MHGLAHQRCGLMRSGCTYCRYNREPVSSKAASSPIVEVFENMLDWVPLSGYCKRKIFASGVHLALRNPSLLPPVHTPIRKWQHTSSSLTQVFVVLLIAALIFIVGQMARHTAMDRKSNSCKMTYSRPEYVPLPVTGFTVEGDAFPGNGTMGNVGYGYRLLRYIDRKLPASDRKHPMRPGGFPVLFVPGHRGNYQQV